MLIERTANVNVILYVDMIGNRRINKCRHKDSFFPTESQSECKYGSNFYFGEEHNLLREHVVEKKLIFLGYKEGASGTKLKV